MFDLVIKSNFEYLNIFKIKLKIQNQFFYLKTFIRNLYIKQKMQNIELINPIRYHKKENMRFNKFIISLVMVLVFGTYFHIYVTNFKTLIINY